MIVGRHQCWVEEADHAGSLGADPRDAAVFTQLSQLLGDPNQVGQLLNSPAALAQIVAGHPALSAFVPSIRAALAGSILDGFVVIFAMSILAVAASLFMPRSIKKPSGEGSPPPPPVAT